MSEFIRSRSCSIAELLSGEERFVLPYFQRGYAWQIEHAMRLLTDLLAVAVGERKLPWYPLGSIILARAAGARDVLLTDGHQRLITLTILLALLRDMERDAALKHELACRIFCDEADGVVEPRLNTLEQIRACLLEHVQQVGASMQPDPEVGEDLSDSEANIIANRRALRDGLAGVSAAERQALARFVLDNCVVVVMEVDRPEIARLLFTTMHATGLPPTEVDLFKSAVLGVIDDESRDAAQSGWEMTEATLGRGHLDILLRQLATIADRERPREAVEERLSEIFALKTATGARDFVQRRLVPVGGHMSDIVAAQIARDDRPAPLQRRLRFLSWVRNHDTWLAPLLHWLDLHGAAGDETLDFVARLEALAWTQMIIAGDPEQRDRRYMEVLGEISDKRVMTRTSPLVVKADEIAEVRKILAAPNFTKRKYKQFLLLRIDAAMRGDDEPLPLPNGTIEHVYPGRPAENSQWRSDFKGARAPILRQTLGNVTLLTIPEQDVAKNKDFALKRPVYESSAFTVTRRLATFDEWKPEAIERRTKDLIDTALRGWGLA